MSTTATVQLPVVFRYHVPGGPLSEFVGVFWYWRGHEVSYARERILPMPSTELVINLGGGRAADAGIHGPRSEWSVIERTAQDELLGIHFNPGGAFPFLDFPLSELHGLSATLADLWGMQEAGDLICRLHDARTIGKKFEILERLLLKLAKKRLNHHPAVSFAMKEFQKDPGLLSSASMAERVGFSQRHFIQTFRDEVGLTPKLFCRVQRFQQVIRKVAQHMSVDWADVALSCGYFDQSHFNHDFREFSGLNPTEYLELRTGHLSHVQIRD
ncbi:MAG TPA: helix-turn-helix domain-containing protein [Pyrinomonadaceae bacterium]|nr:helix-turn-helix domain-containing protein [Pyrinomonadaceae bacterium]